MNITAALLIFAVTIGVTLLFFVALLLWGDNRKTVEDLAEFAKQRDILIETIIKEIHLREFISFLNRKLKRFI